MLNGAVERFKKIPEVEGDPVVLMGMTLRDLGTGPGIDRRDFLARADILAALGKTVMVSNYTRFDSVTSLLRRYTPQWLGFVMGLPTLRAVFDERYYTSLPGGILEGLGRLFQGNVRLYVYPTRARSGEVATSTTLEVDAPTATLAGLPAGKGRDRGHREFRFEATPHVARRSPSRNSKWHARLGAVPARPSRGSHQTTRLVWIPPSTSRTTSLRTVHASLPDRSFPEPSASGQTR